MTDIAASRVRGSPMPPAQPHDDTTHVELTWVEKKIEYWIRFGRQAHEQILDRRRRVVGFQPNAVFAFVRWAANDYGTIISRIDILRAIVPGQSYQTVPFVRPGGEILLKVEGWPKVEDVLRHIDAIQTLGVTFQTSLVDVGTAMASAAPSAAMAVDLT